MGLVLNQIQPLAKALFKYFLRTFSSLVKRLQSGPYRASCPSFRLIVQLPQQCQGSFPASLQEKILLTFFNYGRRTSKLLLFYLLGITLEVNRVKTLDSIWRDSIKPLGVYSNRDKPSSFYYYAFALQLIRSWAFFNPSIPRVTVGDALAILQQIRVTSLILLQLSFIFNSTLQALQ